MFWSEVVKLLTLKYIKDPHRKMMYPFLPVLPRNTLYKDFYKSTIMHYPKRLSAPAG